VSSPRKKCAVAICVVCFAALGLCLPTQAAITRSGTLHAIVTDNFRTGESTTRYTLQSGVQRTVVQPTELAAEPGDRVVVTGRMDDGRLVGAVEATGPSTQAVAPGPRKVAVVLITFPGEPSEPWSPQTSRSEVFTGAKSVNAFYQEESYGGTSLTGKLNPEGDVFGWFRINSPTAGCPYETWRNDAAAAAAAAGVDLTGYQHIIYSFQYQGSCSWFGVAGLGSNWAMINGNVGGSRAEVTTHELGHDLGLMHAGSWTCTAGGVRVQESDDCTVAQYGDPFDVMGNSSTRHNNSWNLAKLGFIGPGNVKTIDATGTYSMRSALHPTAETTTLRVPRARFPNGPVYSWYSLEVREKGGIFENFADATTTGVSIRATEDVSPETLLLDANPATATFQDAPLGVGQTFNGGSVRIKTLSAGGGNATVSIELDEKPPSAPTDLTATAGLEQVSLQWDASSDEFGVARYRVFRDGSEIGTAPGTDFIDVPAPAGDHEYVVYAEDAAGNLSAASDPVTAAVESDVQPPTTPTDLTAVVEDEGVRLEWSASTDNVGVYHYRVLRNGSQIGTSGTEIFDPFAPGGTHTYVVYAVDAAGNQSDPSEPVTVNMPAISGPICSAGSCHLIFRYSGSEATWTVPAGVGAAEFTVMGARGSGDGFNLGAYVAATLGSLTAGEAFTVSVGGKGKPHAAGGEGGFNGGGDGGLGGGGGGFSSVVLGSSLMLLAGGGGGGGADGFNAITEAASGGGDGGEGGKLAWARSPGGQLTGVHGATLDGGDGGAEAGSGGSGGSGGAVTGASTCPGGVTIGAPGVGGGSFAGGGGVAGAGGGGGGGYIGGGQGGGGASDACGSTAGSGGGGGGSSFAAPGLSATFYDGARLNDGQVSVAYSNPVSAAARKYLTARDQELAVNAASGVLSAAAGPSGAPLTASVVGSPTHGSLALNDDGSFTYTPTAGYAGADSFTYRAADPSGNYATAKVSLSVAAPPSASISTPLAGGTYVVGQSVPTGFSCAEGTGGTGLLSCSDSSGIKATGKGAGNLDTSSLGAHTYTVTAVSKGGLTGSASVAYTVVSGLEQKPKSPPNLPDDSPDDPDAPEPKIDLSLSVETKSLRELLRTRKLVLVMKMNKAAKVALAGQARIEVPTRRTVRARLVPVFNGVTIGFSGPGEKEVTLVLSQKGRELLRNLTKLRLAVSGSATDDVGGRVKHTVALSLR
jgi:hypothetical protein